MTPFKTSIADRVLWSLSGWNMVSDVPWALGPDALRAASLTLGENLISPKLPGNQWHGETQHWFELALSVFQAGLPGRSSQLYLYAQCRSRYGPRASY